MKKVSPLLLLPLIVHTATAQLNLDSLQKKLTGTSPTNEALNIYLQKIKKLDAEEMAAKDIMCEWVIANCKKAENDSIKLAATLSLAESYYDRGEYPAATELCNKMLITGNENNNYQLKCASLMLLSNIFYQNEASEKKTEYKIKSLRLAENNNYKKGIAIAKRGIAQDKIGGSSPLPVDSFYMYMDTIRDCIKLWIELKDSANLLHTYTYLAQNYGDYKKFDSAIYTMQLAEPIAKNKELDNISTFYYFIYGKIYSRKANAEKSNAAMTEAIARFKYCLPLTQKLNQKRKESWCYDWISGGYAFLGNYEEAYTYSKKFVHFYADMISEEGIQQLAGIQYKYEELKKDNEILKLNSSNKQKANLNKILTVSASALFLIGFLGYRNFRSRQKLQQQKIAELEKEKQLTAVDALLQGQEEERSRLAQDLHDGLGGMLNGVKLKFNNMKEDLVMTAENAENFQRSVNQLDASIAELRKISHNLMPDSLMRFGLTEALTDYCRSLQTDNVEISFQQMGLHRQLNNTTSLYVYRIIQELTGNAVKHAGASQIIAQLTLNPNKILITVDDNGKGFNTSDLLNSKGMGMRSIKQRADYLKGTMDIDSKPGKGTSVNIELNV